MALLTNIEVHIPADIPGQILEGGRNVTLTRLAGALRAQGLGGAVLADVLQQENRARCVPPLSDREVLAIANSVERYEPGAPRAGEGRPYHPTTAPAPRPKRDFAPALTPPSPAWQERARAFAAYARRYLWENTKHLAYLLDRGLSEDTIRAAGIGYNPREIRDAAVRWGLSGGRVVLKPGWVIPNESGGVMWNVNIRCAFEGDGEGKYRGPREGRKKLYGLDRAGHHSDLVLVEGEFDALLLWQQVGGVATVLALGGAGVRPDVDTLPLLAGYRRWWIATDADDAGDDAAKELQEMTARARRLPMPREGCNDPTDLWRAGVDLVDWIVGQIGPADPTTYLQWAEHYLTALDDGELCKVTDPAHPVLKQYLAVLARYDATRRGMGKEGVDAPSS